MPSIYQIKFHRIWANLCQKFLTFRVSISNFSDSFLTNLIFKLSSSKSFVAILLAVVASLPVLTSSNDWLKISLHTIFQVSNSQQRIQIFNSKTTKWLSLERSGSYFWKITSTILKEEKLPRFSKYHFGNWKMTGWREDVSYLLPYYFPLLSFPRLSLTIEYILTFQNCSSLLLMFPSILTIYFDECLI